MVSALLAGGVTPPAVAVRDLREDRECRKTPHR
jgi:hypothetical protein